MKHRQDAFMSKVYEPHLFISCVTSLSEGATPVVTPGVTSAEATTDVTPGTCRWLLQQPRHLAPVEVKVTCLNKIQMASTVTSHPVLVLLQAPDMTTVT